jgi:hypothetical protein
MLIYISWSTLPIPQRTRDQAKFEGLRHKCPTKAADDLLPAVFCVYQVKEIGGFWQS